MYAQRESIRSRLFNLLLFIFESIGTSELILIGIVALIFLGPRRLPEIARKIGKIMTEFRSTTHEFKTTWEREVNLEEEAKALDLNLIESEEEERERSIGTVARSERVDVLAPPEIKPVENVRIDETEGIVHKLEQNELDFQDNDEEKHADAA